MPLTFAHPAAVLPFFKKSNYVHFTAMVLGSMAPDFEYFLRGQPGGEIGHTLLGFLYFNLPLVVLINIIYHSIIHKSFVLHLPRKLQVIEKKTHDPYKWRRVIVFIYSALFGMVTHIVWDSFTHVNGYMLQKLSVLQHSFTIGGYMVPLYKFLQHGSTMMGLMLILAFLYVRAKSGIEVAVSITSKQKRNYWTMILLVFVLISGLWGSFSFISITSYGIWVVRIIDSTFLSLLVVSIYYQFFVAYNRLRV
jgi:hypothetical protein